MEPATPPWWFVLHSTDHSLSEGCIAATIAIFLSCVLHIADKHLKERLVHIFQVRPFKISFILQPVQLYSKPNSCSSGRNVNNLVKCFLLSRISVGWFQTNFRHLLHACKAVLLANSSNVHCFVLREIRSCIMQIVWPLTAVTVLD